MITKAYATGKPEFYRCAKLSVNLTWNRVGEEIHLDGLACIICKPNSETSVWNQQYPLGTAGLE